MIERLDLALLVDRHDNRISGRVQVDAGDVIDLGGERTIVGLPERPDPMRLKVMGFPDLLHGSRRNAHHLGYRVPGQRATWPGGTLQVSATPCVRSWWQRCLVGLAANGGCFAPAESMIKRAAIDDDWRLA